MYNFSGHHIGFNKKIIFFAKERISALTFYKENIILCYDPDLVKSNTICLTPQGQEVWRMTALRDAREERSFNALHTDEDGKYWVYSEAGYSCNFDPETGKIIEQIWAP